MENILEFLKAVSFFYVDEKPPVAGNGRVIAKELERRHGIKLPELFKTYLEEEAYFEDWMDKGGIIWWSAERIKNGQDEYGCKIQISNNKHVDEIDENKYLIFADFLDWCYAYAICCSDGEDRGKIAIIGSLSNRFVAKNFSSFVKLAASYSLRLHSPGGDNFTDII